VGKDWFARAQEIVDKGADLRKTTPTIFYSHYPMSQMNYSEALEKDGVFEERARYSWAKAGKDWFDFGARLFTTADGDRTFHLNDVEAFDAEAAKRLAALEAIEPGLREKIRKERYDKLAAADRKAYDAPPQKRTTRDWERASQVTAQLRVTHEQVGRAVKGQSHDAAVKLAREATDFEKRSAEIRIYRGVVNFEQWRLRAQFEQTPEACRARQKVYEGAQAMANGDLLAAARLYEEGFASWRQLFDRKDFPQLKNDESLGEQVVEMIYQYRRVLDKSDKPFPKTFVLDDVLQIHEKAYKARQGIK
jgi:hypothetical protein